MITERSSDFNQTDGIVIRTYASGENDLVLRILTPRHGKISVFAKGIRSSRRRFMGGIEIFDRGEFYFTRRRNLKQSSSSLLMLDNFQVSSGSYSFRDDLLKLSLGSLLCEVYDGIIKEEQDDDSLSAQYFESFSLALEALSSVNEKNELLRACFLSLKGLMCSAGFLDRTEVEVPTRANLRKILDRVETCLERKLMTRKDFERLQR